MAPTDIYQRVGLRRNPFTVDQKWEGVVPELMVDTGLSLESRHPIPSQRRFIQLIGDKGAGKSTHLYHWRRQVPGGFGYVPNRPYYQRYFLMPVGPVCYWDEVDRYPKALLLEALGRARLCAATVVCGTHRDLGWLARCFGFAVETIHFGIITSEAVLRWSNRRIAYACLDEATLRHPPLVVTPTLAEEVARMAHTSWRRVGDELHGWAAKQVAHHARTAPKS